MNYEVVHLKEKTVAGITIRTSNNDPNMGKAIGETWQREKNCRRQICKICS